MIKLHGSLQVTQYHHSKNFIYILCISTILSQRQY